MKRANETPAFPGHASAFTNAQPNLRTSQQPAPSTASTTSTTSTASTGTNAGIRPGMTSMANRAGVALWPPAPLRFNPQAGYPAYPNHQPQPQPHAMAMVVHRPPLLDQVPGFQYVQQHLPSPPAAQPAAAPSKLVGDQGDRDIFKNTTLELQVKSEVSGCSSGWTKTVHSLKGKEKTDFLIVSFFAIAMKHGSHGAWNRAINRIMDMVGMDAMLAQKWPGNCSLAHILARVKEHKWLALALARDGALQSLHSSDEQGFSPLHVAVIRGKKKMVEAILAHDDEAGSLRLRKFRNNFIALHLACENDHGSTVALLLGSKGKEQRLSGSANGVLPIHEALATCGGALQHLLAECALEQVSARFWNGANALMVAARSGSQNNVKMLLDVPGGLAVQLGARDGNGRGAIDCARNGGNAEIISLIETAMQSLSAASSSSTTSTTTTTSTAATVAVAAGARQGPVPLTPYPTSRAAEDDFGFSDTEIESDEQ